MKRIYRILLVTVLAVSVLFFATPASGQTWKQWDRSRVNSLRAAHGVAPLGYKYVLQLEAQRWADRMARLGYTKQNYNVGPCWSFISATAFGDNVGQGPTVPWIQYYLERSPTHRANLLDRHYRWMGIGIAWGRGTFWLDQVFCG